MEIGFRHQRPEDQFIVVGRTVALAQFLDGWLLRRTGQNFLGTGRRHDLIEHVRINRGHRLTVKTRGILDHFVGYDRIALAGDDVEYGQCADQLAERRCHARIAELTSDTGGFGQHLVELVAHLVLCELRLQRAGHPARDLMLDGEDVVLAVLVDKVAGFNKLMSRLCVWPFNSMFLTMISVEGTEGPLANGRLAVCKIETPSSMESR